MARERRGNGVSGAEHEPREPRISAAELVASGQGDTRVGLGLSVNATLKHEIEQRANEVGKSARRLALEVLADHFGVAVPETMRVVSARSEEDEAARKEARKAKGAERRALIKELLAAHRAAQEAATATA